MKKVNIILSAERTGLSASENRLRTNRLRTILKAFEPVTEVLGCYKGTRENSFMVNTGEGGIAIMLDIAKSFDQESILVVESNGKVSLHYTLDNVESIGALRVAPEAIAKTHEAWSKINGFYVVAV